MRHGLAVVQSRLGPLVLFPFVALRTAALVALAFAALAVAAGYATWRECAAERIGCRAWIAENAVIGGQNVLRRPSRLDDPNWDPVWQSPLMPMPAPDPARRRILVLGDSLVWGSGLIDANRIWWRDLQRELAWRGYGQVDIVAAGGNGASTQDQLGWLERHRLIERTAPALVLLGYVPNDPSIADASGRMTIPQVTPVGPETCLPRPVDRLLDVLAPSLLDRLRQQCATAKETRRERAGQGFRYTRWEQELLTPPNLARYGQVVQALGERVRGAGLPLVVATMARWRPGFDPPGDPIYAPVAPLFRAAGADWLDLSPALAARLEGVPPWQVGLHANPVDSHPGPMLGRFYATRIADHLERHYPQALGPRQLSPVPPQPRITSAMPPWIGGEALGPGQWRLHADDGRRAAYRLPVGEPHGVLGFDTPVRLRRLEFTADRPVEVAAWGHFVDETDGHVSAVPIAIGRSTGTGIVLEFPERLAARRLGTLRLRLSVGTADPMLWSVTLDPAAFQPERRHAYIVPLPSPHFDPAATAPQHDPDIMLLEDGRPMPFPGSLHDDIRGAGRGRFSVWTQSLYFSSSDKTDPRRNGRTYTLAKRPPLPSVTMTASFAEEVGRP